MSISAKQKPMLQTVYSNILNSKYETTRTHITKTTQPYTTAWFEEYLTIVAISSKVIKEYLTQHESYQLNANTHRIRCSLNNNNININMLNIITSINQSLNQSFSQSLNPFLNQSLNQHLNQHLNLSISQ